jgi:hypothetical protein
MTKTWSIFGACWQSESNYELIGEKVSFSELFRANYEIISDVVIFIPL